MRESRRPPSLYESPGEISPGLFCFSPFYLFVSEILRTFAERTRRIDDELNDDVTMDILHIIAVVALMIIGGFIYWNKTRG